MLLECESSHPDCQRIWKRLHRHADEILTFLEEPGVPADNNGGENDIRSVAAARGDGGVNRSNWGAKAFANLKSVVRTCQKSGVRYLDYMLRLVRAVLDHDTLPLPLKDIPPATSAAGST
jgi:transposase